jgi:hypothetical protein
MLAADGQFRRYDRLMRLRRFTPGSSLCACQSCGDLTAASARGLGAVVPLSMSARASTSPRVVVGSEAHAFVESRRPDRHGDARSGAGRLSPSMLGSDPTQCRCCSSRSSA